MTPRTERRQRRCMDAAAGVLAILLTLALLCASAGAASSAPAHEVGSTLAGEGTPSGGAGATEEEEVEEVEEEEEVVEVPDESASAALLGENSESVVVTESNGESPASSQAPNAFAVTPSSTRWPFIRLSGLALTPGAVALLQRTRQTASAIEVSFTLSAAATMRVTLAKQVMVKGRMRLKRLPDSLTIVAGKGRNRRHLSGRNMLAPGRDRLTLKPVHGRSRSIVIRVP